MARGRAWIVIGIVAACGGSSESKPVAQATGPGPTNTPAADAGTAPDSAQNSSPPSDASAAPDVVAGKAYDVDGPVAYTTKVEPVDKDGTHAFDVTVYMPSTPGPHPVVSLSCGSTQTANAYVPYAKRLASYGIAMVLKDDPGALVNTADIVPDAEYVVSTWMPQAHGADFDLARVGLAGHSRGGAVSLLAAERGLAKKVVAWFGLDPVDNEFLVSPGLFARTKIGEIGITTAFLGADVISNCAPAADGYGMLYPKAPSPSTLIVGKGAGHTQLAVASACTACAFCSPSGTQPDDVVLAYAVRYLTAFFARELLGDGSVGAKFEGAGGTGDVAAGLVTIATK